MGMALVPYDPFRQMESLRREMERAFGFREPLFAGLERMGIPAVDVYETDGEVVASCELPGLEKKDDVHIDINQNILTISGAVQRGNENRTERAYRSERYFGRFERSVPLPARVDAEKARATYRNGILEIRMPKSTQQQTRGIDIEFH